MALEIDGALQAPLSPAQQLGVNAAAAAAQLTGGVSGVPVNSLTSTSTIQPLSAAQGAALSIQIAAAAATGGIVGVVIPGGSVSVTYGGATTSLQAALNTIASQLNSNTGSSSVPVNTAAPAAPTGSVAVTSTLTAGNGSWTNSPTQYKYQWYDQNTTTGVNIAISGATASTYATVASDVGFKVTYTVAAANANNVYSNPVYAASPSSVITATLPTYSGGVAPAVTPSGSQASGTILGCSTGTLNGGNTGATFAYQWLFTPTGGVATAIAGATTNFYTTLTSQGGTGGVSCAVTPTTSQGTGAAGVSNLVTITGGAALVFATTPTFSSSLQIGVANGIMSGTFSTGVPDPTCTFRVYIQEYSTTNPWLTFTNVPTSGIGFTAPINWVLPSGSFPLAGDHLGIDQICTVNGVGPYQSAISSWYLVSAGANAVIATVVNSTLAMTVGTAFSGQPITASGGVAALKWTLSSPASLPAGLFLNSSTGAITGSPLQSTVTPVAITLSVTDGTTTAQGTFTISISAAAISPIYVLNASALFANDGQAVQMLGGAQALSTVSETVGVTGSGTIVNQAGVASTLRFGKVPDPLNTARNVFYCAIKSSDPTTYGHMRTEVGSAPGSPPFSDGIVYWRAAEIYIPPTRLSGGATGGAMMQVHQSNGIVDPFGPWALNAYPPNVQLVIGYGDSTNGGATPGGLGNPPFSGNFVYNNWNQSGANDGKNYPTNVWNKWVVQWKQDWTGAAGGFLKAWMNGVLMVSYTGPIGIYTPGFLDYPKIGCDDFGGGGGGTNGTFEMFRSDLSVADNGYTEPQIRALLT